jgi:thioredoxin-related protein
MKKIIVLILSLFTTALYAEDGIQFTHGTWKETLAKAKKENKLIFIDMYTSWCGPCKQMVADVFPLKSVGDKFNTNFINYKLDAEKGEGVVVAKAYKVNAYPTYLFVNGDGVLYYTTVGFLPEKNFLAEVDKALAEFADPRPLAVWEAEYAAKKNDKEYLKGYIEKRNKKRMAANELVDQYASLCSKEELLSQETLNYLWRLQGATFEGLFYDFLASKKSEVAKALGRPETAVNEKLATLATGGLQMAIAKKDVELMEKIIAARKTLFPGTAGEESALRTRVSFYTQTKNEKELIKALDAYIKVTLGYDMNATKPFNVAELKTEIVKARNLTAQSSSNFAYNVRDIANSAFMVVNDKRMLNEALKWLNIAGQFSNNFTINEVRAGIFQKLGRREEAIKQMELAKEAWATAKMDNDVITNRLNERLQKIKDNEPTWTENLTTVTTKK